MMVIQNLFNITDIVYLKTDKDQLPRIITAIKVTGDGGLTYELYAGTTESFHYEFELDAEKNMATITS